jgi:hypothetical protein
MSLLSKPLDAITVEDVADLITSQARETGELEFKGSLPNKKGLDPWLSGESSIGDHARNEILSEMIAFANAEGGTLVIGVYESSGNARRAERLEALPNCEELAKRLIDAAQNVIEPRLDISARGIPDNPDGSGFVVLRTGKSLCGPHRLTTTREFYIRRGERTERMTAREIQDLTLALARSADIVESLFIERQNSALRQHHSLLSGNWSALLLRVTAIPIVPKRIPGLTSRTDLWWTGQTFPIRIDDHPIDWSYPVREFIDVPRRRLRRLETRVDVHSSRGTERLLDDNGLIEFRLVSGRSMDSPTKPSAFYLGWLAGLLFGAISQIQHLRAKLAWDAIQYGLEIGVLSNERLVLALSNHDEFLVGEDVETALTLPRYSVPFASEDLDALMNLILSDLYNAGGREWMQRCSIEWQ